MSQDNNHITTNDANTADKGTGFIVPDHYFDKSKSAILFRTTQKSSNTGGFSVPPSYFNDSKNKILQVIQPNQQPYIHRLAAHPFFKIAAILVVLMGLKLLIKQDHPIESSSFEANLSSDEIINYISNNGATEIPLAEITKVDFHPSIEPSLSADEKDILNQTDEQLILEQL